AAVYHHCCAGHGCPADRCDKGIRLRSHVTDANPPRFASNTHVATKPLSVRAATGFYRLLTTVRGAGLFSSSWALTFWICAACSLSCAVRVSICFCCCATVASNFSTLPTLPLSMAGRWVGAPGALRGTGALRGAPWVGLAPGVPTSQPSLSFARSIVTSTTLPPTGWKLLKIPPMKQAK